MHHMPNPWDLDIRIIILRAGSNQWDLPSPAMRNDLRQIIPTRHHNQSMICPDIAVGLLLNIIGNGGTNENIEDVLNLR